MDAWPMESTKRSRFGHTGSCGSKRRNFCQRLYATGAIAIGVPGCPEFAVCTASMDSVRIVLMQVRSMFPTAGGAETVAKVIQKSFLAVTRRPSVTDDRVVRRKHSGFVEPLMASADDASCHCASSVPLQRLT